MKNNVFTKFPIRIISGFLAMVLFVSLLPSSAFAALDLICGKEEHTHQDSCYEEVERVSYSCAPGEYIHTHDSFCYDNDGNLTCTLEEAEAHTHTENCYTQLEDTQNLICGLEETEPHTHTDACMVPVGDRMLGCTIDSSDHTHTDECYIYVPEGFEYKIRDFYLEEDDPAFPDGHLPVNVYFPDGAYTGQKIWGKIEYIDPSFEERVTHIRWRIRDHEDTSIKYYDGSLDDTYIILNEAKKYSVVVTIYYINDEGEENYGVRDSSFELVDPELSIGCGLEETAGHTHTDDCYETIPGEVVLSCELPERHVHTETCYDADGHLICEKEEAVVHQHTEDCREISVEQVLVCGKEEHEHTEDCLEDYVIIDGKTYPCSDFTPMGDFLTSAILSSNGTTYDLMNGTLDEEAINIYHDLSLSLSWNFQSQGSGLDPLYSWQFPGVNLKEPVQGSLQSVDGINYGTYYIDTDGTVYVVLSEAGMLQSVLIWQIEFSAQWVKDSDRVSIDLGNGKVIEIVMDTRRAVVEKTANTEDNPDGVFSYTVDISALDDVVITGIDDTITARTGASAILDWCDEFGIPIEEALWIKDVSITLGDGSVIDIPEEQVLVENLGFNENDYPQVLYHIEFPELISINSGDTVTLNYQIYLDPELTAYLDFRDAHYYRLDNKAEVFIQDGDSITAEDWAQHSQRDMIRKEMTIIDSTSASWTVTVQEGLVYSLDGMLIHDVIVPEFSYLTTSPFIYSYGSRSGTLGVHLCETEDEFNALTSDTAAGMVHIYKNSFKFFIPDGGELSDDGLYHDAFSLSYQSTYNEEDAAIYGSGGRLNYAEIVYQGQTDSATDGRIAENILKTNDGIHIDEDGLLYTNWSIAVDVPRNTVYERFFYEDYVPHDGLEGKDLIVDTLHLTEDISLDGVRRKYETLQEVLDLGIGLSIVTKSGKDITNDVFGAFYIHDLTLSSEYHYFTMALGDTNHANSSGGFDAMDEDYTVTITVPMYLNGDAETFKEHENRVVWYFTEDYQNKEGQSSLDLPYINNDEYLSKKVVDSTLSDDGTKTILTYQARYNMYDKLDKNGYVSGSGYTFTDKLSDTTYAKYVPGSLKIYWTETIDDTERWSYGETTSPYYGETNLLAIEEDVPHKSDEDDDGTNKYVYERLATVLEESESGFRVKIPYYMPTSGYRWREEGHSTVRFYSPLFEYQVEVDTKALTENKIYRYGVENTFRTFLTDGTLDASSESNYKIDSSILKKNVIQRPTAENEHVVKYQLMIDASSDAVRDLARIDVIDTIDSSEIKLLVDQMVVEFSEDGLLWNEYSSDHYRLMYDYDENRITCLLDNDPCHNHYRITYALQLNGLAGDQIPIGNSAFVVGFSEQQAETSDIFEVSSSSGYAEGQIARIEIYKYNDDNVEMSIPGAVFRLSCFNDKSAESYLNTLDSQEAVLNAIDTNYEWTPLIEQGTDEQGSIIWEHNGSSLSLSLDTLYKIEEIKAPSGYNGLAEPIYFYLSASNENPGTYLQYFDREPIQATLYIANGRSSFILEKRDADTGELLTGAVFGLFSTSDCTGEPLMESIDYEDGSYYFGDLEFGNTYYLKEIEAPTFYNQDDTIYTVSISDQGIVNVSPILPFENGRYIITNTIKPSAVLPETGGPGTLGQTFAGLFLSAAAIFLIHKRKEDRYE